MGRIIKSANTRLDYPLYACDFDPADSSKLVVGGGGGAGRSGVGNRITLLDTSVPEGQLQQAGEIDLSKDEDNVTSLGVGQQKGTKTLVYAGINSSPKDVEQGKNEHFRVFGMEAPSTPKEKDSPSKGKKKSGERKKTDGEKKTSSKMIDALSRNSLFVAADKDTYQRVLRLSKPLPGQLQVGAVATGFAKKSSIVLFDTPKTASSPPNKRGTLELDKEAVDMDFIQTGTNQYLFAYCDEHRVYTKEITSKTDMEEPKCIYITPASDSVEKPTVPAFRAMRWLTPEFLLMLTNIHSQGGAVLQILRLPPSGEGKARIAQSYRLSSQVTKATGLSVSNLTPPLTATAKQEYTQFVIAVAGQDMSVRLFKVDLQVASGVYMVTSIKPFHTLKNVHPLQITGIAFSNLTPPSHPVTASTPAQYLKLASVSVGNTVVVNTIPLFPVPLSVKRGQSMTPRYVVALPSDNALFGFGIILTIILALFGAIATQSILEIRGGVAPYLGASNYIPLHWQEAIGKPYVFPEDYTSTLDTVSKLQGHAATHLPGQKPNHIRRPIATAEKPIALPDWFKLVKEDSDKGVIYLHNSGDGVRARLIADEKQVPASAITWDDLAHAQKEGWKKKLKDAGHWAEDMGESIFKGIIFGELAGAVGAAVAG